MNREYKMYQIYEKIGLDTDFYMYWFNDIGSWELPRVVKPCKAVLKENVEYKHPDFQYYVQMENGDTFTNPYLFMNICDSLENAITEYNKEVHEWEDAIIKHANEMNDIVNRYIVG